MTPHIPRSTSTPRLAVHPRAASLLLLAAGIFLATSSSARAAETPAPHANAEVASPATVQPADASLPDSPGAILSSRNSLAETSSSLPDPAQSTPTRGLPMASKSDLYIAPGQPAPTLTFKDKFDAGFKNAVSPFAAVGWLVSAGYSQGFDNSPNYGQDGKAFAQRLGAAAARSSSERIFSDSILAGVLHEDPRYYRLGPGHSFIHRVAYAGTRTLLTRTDSGHRTPNFSLLGGNLGGAYLTTAYYPAKNTTTGEVLSTFGGSLAGSAIGFVVSEFLSGALNIFHSSKPTSD